MIIYEPGPPRLTGCAALLIMGFLIMAVTSGYGCVARVFAP